MAPCLGKNKAALPSALDRRGEASFGRIWNAATMGDCRGGVPEPNKSGRLHQLELAFNHPLERFDRLKIFRRDLVLWNCEVELGLHAEHQIDHVRRGQTDIDQTRARGDIGCDLILRDVLSSPLMINNERILSNIATSSLMSGVPTSLRD